MIIETKEIYKCKHCRKLYQRKYACEKHENKCNRNPINASKCLEGCMNLTKLEVEYIDQIYINGFIDDITKTKNILYCIEKKEGVCPRWVEPLDIDVPNNVMPKECALYKAGLGINDGMIGLMQNTKPLETPEHMKEAFELAQIIESNYKSVLKRGFYQDNPTKLQIIDKLKEEVQEFIEAVEKNLPNENEELADIVLVCLNYAKHFGIDIEKELISKIEINFER